MKLVICPVGVIIASYLFPNINFANIGQAVILGVILAIAGTALEYVFLREGTLWTSTAMDWVASTVVIYFVSFLFTGAEVTFVGAALAGLLLAITEYFQHRYLIESGKTTKTA